MIGSVSTFCNRSSVINSTTTKSVSMMSPRNKIFGKEKSFPIHIIIKKTKKTRTIPSFIHIVSYLAYHKFHLSLLSLNFNFSNLYCGRFQNEQRN